VSLEAHLGIAPERGHHQIHVHSHQNVATPHCPRGRAKEPAISENRPDEVVETTHASEKISEIDRLSTVIGVAASGITQDLVSLGHSTKASLGSRITRIGIRMGIPGQPAEGALYILGRGSAVNSEVGVVVTGHLTHRLRFESSNPEELQVPMRSSRPRPTFSTAEIAVR
jgi:hypothetical protein